MKVEQILMEGIEFSIITHDDDEVQQINEARQKGRPLTGNYSYELHSAHNPTGEYHIHLYEKGKEILSINKSGTAHDGYHQTRIPNKAYQALKNKYSDWNWPKNQIIESAGGYTYFFEKEDKFNRRLVRVSKYTLYAQSHEGFIGFFHQFAEDPFLTGGDGGYKEKTVAIVETMEGYVRKTTIEAIQFLDV